MVDKDVPCPKCEYNLRGLTEPRCPECGFQFEWSKLGALHRPRLSDTQVVLGVALIVTYVLTVAALAGLLGAVCLGLGVAAMERARSTTVALIVFAVVMSLVQTALELVVSCLFIGSITAERFRGWWAGLLAGYALCVPTVLLAAQFFDLGAVPTTLGETLFIAGFWAVIIAEAFVVQWTVVRWRFQRWEETITARCLILACLAAKFGVGVPLVFVAHRLGLF